MAVTFLQSQKNRKPATKPAQDFLQEDQADVTLQDPIVLQVDKLVALNSQLEPLAPVQRDFDATKKLLAAHAANEAFASSEKVILAGSNGNRVEFSCCRETTVITDLNGLIGLLKGKLGYEGLLAVLKINLSDAQKYLSEAELAPYVETKPGSRTLKSITSGEAA